ncbi:hypothetical protein GCM10017711_24860 [Paeniglutamicibacter sulfureus]
MQVGYEYSAERVERSAARHLPVSQPSLPQSLQDAVARIHQIVSVTDPQGACNALALGPWHEGRATANTQEDHLGIGRGSSGATHGGLAGCGAYGRGCPGHQPGLQ